MKRYILLIAILLAACGSSPQQPAVVLPVLISTEPAFIDPLSYPTAEAQVAVPNQEANGIDVRIEHASVDGKNVNANACFTLPDMSDWSIMNASLNYGGTVVQEFGTTLVSLQEPENGGTGLRCDMLTFIVPPDADLSNATIEIESIGAIPREGEYCSVYMPKIQQSMLDRGIGISLDCLDVDGLLTMKIMSIPPEMTQEQAEQIVYSDDFYTVKGPWSFSFNLAQ